jgi:inosine-uridine nucleoside N-ribohydrolase
VLGKSVLFDTDPGSDDAIAHHKPHRSPLLTQAAIAAA